MTLVREVVEAYLKSLDTAHREHPDQWVAWVLSARLVAFIWFAAWWRRGQLTEAAGPGLKMLQEGLLEWIGMVRPAISQYLA